MRYLALLAACSATTVDPPSPDLSAAADLSMAMMPDLSVAGDLAQPPGDFAVTPPDMASADLTPPHKRVFVTSGAWKGNLQAHGGGIDGLNGGDKLCNTAAAALGGTWVAWLSDDNHDALGRINDVGPWYRLDGMKVFDNKAALAGHPLVAINLTETGGAPTGTSVAPFTGTNNGGTKAANNCTNWTMDTGSGECGSAGSTADAWTQSAPLSCAVVYSLYCFEQ